jgi:quercetin dioxygenase-like cupin family protein
MDQFVNGPTGARASRRPQMTRPPEPLGSPFNPHPRWLKSSVRRLTECLYQKEIAMSIADSASACEVIMVGQMSIRYLIDGAATGGMGVFELGVPPNSNVPPPHSHTANEECVYVLEGVLRYAVDGVERDLRPGDWMFTPRGSVHQFSNPHNALARALIVLAPDIGAQYFRDVGAVVNVGGSPDRTKLLAIMSKQALRNKGINYASSHSGLCPPL